MSYELVAMICPTENSVQCQAGSCDCKSTSVWKDRADTKVHLCTEHMNSIVGDDKISSTMDRIKDLGSFHGFFINDEHAVKFQKRALMHHAACLYDGCVFRKTFPRLRDQLVIHWQCCGTIVHTDCFFDYVKKQHEVANDIYGRPVKCPFCCQMLTQFGTEQIEIMQRDTERDEEEEKEWGVVEEDKYDPVDDDGYQGISIFPDRKDRRTVPDESSDWEHYPHKNEWTRSSDRNKPYRTFTFPNQNDSETYETVSNYRREMFKNLFRLRGDTFPRVVWNERHDTPPPPIFAGRGAFWELTAIDGELRDSSGKAFRFIFYRGSIPVLSTSLDELVKGAQILHIHGSRKAEQIDQTEKYVNAEVFGEDYDLNQLVDRRKQPRSLQVALYCHCCGLYYAVCKEEVLGGEGQSEISIEKNDVGSPSKEQPLEDVPDVAPSKQRNVRKRKNPAPELCLPPHLMMRHEKVTCKCCPEPQALELDVRFEYNRRVCPPLRDKNTSYAKISKAALKRHNPFGDIQLEKNTIITWEGMKKDDADGLEGDRLENHISCCASLILLNSVYYGFRNACTGKKEEDSIKPVCRPPRKNDGLQTQIEEFFQALMVYASDKAREKYKTVILKYMGEENSDQSNILTLLDESRRDQMQETILMKVEKIIKDLESCVLGCEFHEKDETGSSRFDETKQSVIVCLENSLRGDSLLPSFLQTIKNMKNPNPVKRKIIYDKIISAANQAFQQNLTHPDYGCIQKLSGAIDRFKKVLAYYISSFPAIEMDENDYCQGAFHFAGKRSEE